MKSRFFLTAILFLIVGSTLPGAAVESQPGHFALQGEILYVKPLIEQAYFTHNGNFISPATTRRNNNLHWRPAYRLTGIYAFCNCVNDFEVRATYFDVKHTRNLNSAVPEFQQPTQGLPTNTATILQTAADSFVHNQFWAVEAMLGQLLYNCYPFHLAIQGGLNYTNIRYREIVHFDFLRGVLPPVDSLLTQKDHFWGIGPEIGINFKYLLPWQCLRSLSLTGDFRTALLIGNSKSSYDQTVNGASFFNAENESLWRVVPVGDFRFGLAYEFCCWRLNSCVELGYEVLLYSRAIHKTSYHDVVGNNGFSGSDDFYNNFGFHGPYLLLGCRF